MVYQIVDWLYRKLDRDFDFRSRQAVRDAALRLDNQNKIQHWMDKSADWYTDVHKDSKYDHLPRSGKSLKDGVDDRNEEYISEEKAKVEKIEHISKLKEYPIESSFETDTQQKLASIIKTRIEAVGVDKETIREVESIIKSAKTQDDLDKIVFGEIERRSNRATRERVSAMIAEAGSMLETLEEETERLLTEQIKSATSAEELERIDISKAKTDRSEDKLRGLVSEKMRTFE